MKKLYLIGNWKSNLTTDQAKDWIKNFTAIDFSAEEVINKEVVICPPILLLPFLKPIKDLTNGIQLKLGSQNISPFQSGAFTGEEPPELVKEYAEYTIIGHSERRKYFQETEDLLLEKVENAIKYGFFPIYCVQNESTPIPQEISMVAYEPPSAIGTGNPDTPENAERVAQIIKNKYKNVSVVLYGGSVTPDNIKKFIDMENISGVLVGTASLNGTTFATLIKNASR